MFLVWSIDACRPSLKVFVLTLTIRQVRRILNYDFDCFLVLDVLRTALRHLGFQRVQLSWRFREDRLTYGVNVNLISICFLLFILEHCLRCCAQLRDARLRGVLWWIHVGLVGILQVLLGQRLSLFVQTVLNCGLLDEILQSNFNWTVLSLEWWIFHYSNRCLIYTTLPRW